MYHGTPNSDPEKIKTALWTMLTNALSATAEAEVDVSGCKVFVTNRPDASAMDMFAVVDINGTVTDYDGYSRCVCMVQLFAMDIDKIGTPNMVVLSNLYDTLVSALPYNEAPYTFSKKNQIGRRDPHGFHVTMVNLDCLIYKT